METQVWARGNVREAARSLAPLGALLVATLVYLGWELAHAGVYAYATSIYPISDADEWRYTACSRLVYHGYALFSQVFSAQPPLLFVSLAAGMRVFGDSIVGARAAEILFGLLALWVSVAMCWLLRARWGAALCGLLLSVSPGFLVYAHTVEAEGPQMALGALALACTIAYRRFGWLAWLPLAGLALAASVLTKLFALETALPVLWMLCYGRKIDRQTVRDVLTVGVSAVVPLVLDFALFSPTKQWDQVVRLHDVAAGLSLAHTQSPLTIVGQYLALDLGLTVLAVAGLIVLAMCARWRDFGLAITWLVVTALMLVLFRPLFPHHPAILAAPLAVTAGLGADAALGVWRGRRLVLVVGVLAAIGYLLSGSRLVHADRHLLVAAPSPGSLPLAVLLQKHSSATDLVAVDDLELADGANRLVVPPLCDPSNVRLQAGYLTSTAAIAATVKFRPTAVLSSFGIFVQPQLHGYVSWLRGHYQVRTEPGGAQLYLRPPGENLL